MGRGGTYSSSQRMEGIQRVNKKERMILVFSGLGVCSFWWDLIVLEVELVVGGARA